MAKQQYIIQKYVLAESLAEAVRKSRKIPIHEVFISNAWFEKQNSEFYRSDKKSCTGFGLSTPKFKRP